MFTRREFGKLAVAGLVVARPEGRALRLNDAEGIDSKINGVRLGVQTYSFRDIPRPAGAADSVDVVIKAMTEAGLGRMRAVLAATRAAVRLRRARRAGRSAVARRGEGA